MSMKKIAVFFKLPGAMDPPLATPDYWTAYSELTAEVSRLGGQLYIVRGQETYLGNGSFSKSWVIENDKLVETGPVTVAVLYDKGIFTTDRTIPIFNNETITHHFDNKWVMYERLSKYCPQTFYVENTVQLHAILPKISTDRAVFKPYLDGGGDGVKIEEKKYFTQDSVDLRFPAVVSEFLDMSVGIPGIVEGIHDLRLAVFDGEVLYSYVRTPPKGSLLANVAKGGTFRMVELSKLPRELIDIVNSVDADFRDCGHRFYSIDFGYTTDGPKIIETNGMLGLLPNKDHPIFKTLKEKLAHVFMEL